MMTLDWQNMYNSDWQSFKKLIKFKTLNYCTAEEFKITVSNKVFCFVNWKFDLLVVWRRDAVCNVNLAHLVVYLWFLIYYSSPSANNSEFCCQKGKECYRQPKFISKILLKFGLTLFGEFNFHKLIFHTRF